MDTHGIAVSVVSSANPWIDFVEPDEAPALAAELNDDLEALCAASAGRLLGFGVLALQRPENPRRSSGASPVTPYAASSSARPGEGGPRRSDFEPIWKAAADAGLFVFIHPHYGIGHGLFPDTGHAMMLALGFTFETRSRCRS